MISVVFLWMWRLTSLTYKTTSLSMLQLYKPLLGFVAISCTITRIEDILSRPGMVKGYIVHLVEDSINLIVSGKIYKCKDTIASVK